MEMFSVNGCYFFEVGLELFAEAPQFGQGLLAALAVNLEERVVDAETQVAELDVFLGQRGLPHPSLHSSLFCSCRTRRPPRTPAS